MCMVVWQDDFLEGHLQLSSRSAQGAVGHSGFGYSVLGLVGWLLSGR